jgi:hypothetical protein
VNVDISFNATETMVSTDIFGNFKRRCSWNGRTGCKSGTFESDKAYAVRDLGN